MDQLTRYALIGQRQDAESIPPSLQLELDTLREFFQCWEKLHSIQGDKRQPKVKKAHEDAALELVERAHLLRQLNSTVSQGIVGHG